VPTLWEKLLFFVAMLCLLGAWLVFSPIFDVQSVEISGDTAFRALLPSNVRHNKVLFVDERTFLENDVRAEKVFVIYVFPSKILLRFEEKTAVYLLNAGELFGISANAEILPISHFAAVPNLPIIFCDECTNLEFFRTVTDEPVRRCVKFLNDISLHQPEILDAISEIHSLSANEFELFLTDDNIKVRVDGNGSNLQRLELILNNLGEKRSQVFEIDLRYPEQGVVRFRENGA